VATGSRKVRNIEAANQQLEAAAKMFFENGDPVAVHTLASAAWEIYAKHSKRTGRRRIFDLLTAKLPPGAKEKDLSDVLNKRRNFFKHASQSPNKAVDISDLENEIMLMMAASDAKFLLGEDAPAVVTALLVWYDISYRNKDKIQDAPSDLTAAITRFWNRFPNPPDAEYSQTIGERKHLWRVMFEHVASDIKPKSSLDLALEVILPEITKLQRSTLGKH
jgi:hypothetical protein